MCFDSWFNGKYIVKQKHVIVAFSKYLKRIRKYEYFKPNMTAVRIVKTILTVDGTDLQVSNFIL